MELLERKKTEYSQVNTRLCAKQTQGCTLANSEFFKHLKCLHFCCCKEGIMAKQAVKKRLTKAETQERIGWAKQDFIKNGMTQEEVADKYGISKTTINKYAQSENWKKYRKNFTLTREEQMANLLEELVEINEAIKNKPEGERYADSKLGDVRRKLVRDIESLETSASIPEMIHAITMLINFVKKSDLDKAKELAPITDSFIKSLL